MIRKIREPCMLAISIEKIIVMGINSNIEIIIK